MSKLKKDYLNEFVKAGGTITDEIKKMTISEIKKLTKNIEKKKKFNSKGKYTHIDRSNGQLLRKADLNKKKPWLSPISNQATVEELTKEEQDSLKTK